MELCNLEKVNELKLQLDELNQLSPSILGILNTTKGIIIFGEANHKIALTPKTNLANDVLTGMVEGIIKQVGSVIDSMVELGVVIDRDDEIIALEVGPDPKMVSLSYLDRNTHAIMLGDLS